jgi:hypothetical protein
MRQFIFSIRGMWDQIVPLNIPASLSQAWIELVIQAWSQSKTTSALNCAITANGKVENLVASCIYLQFFKIIFKTSNLFVSSYLSTSTTGWTIGRSRFDPRQGQIFLLAPASRPALGPTQLPIQWAPGVLSPGVKRSRGVTLTTHPHLVPRLRMSRSYTSSVPCASMACSGTAFICPQVTLPKLRDGFQLNLVL